MDYLVGLDGGASKTKAVLVAADGRIVARYRGGGCRMYVYSFAEGAPVLGDAIASLCRNAGVERDAIKAFGLGIHGIDFEDQLPVQLEATCAAVQAAPEKVALVNDGIIALWGASPSAAAGIIQYGTGLTSACRAAYGAERLFDHLNVGRVFDMRHELIAVVARMIDGRVQATPLKDRLLRHFGIDDEAGFAEAIYRGKVASNLQKTTPPLVYEAWAAGDPAADRLVTETVEDFALLAEAIVRRIARPSVEIAFGGGVITLAPPRFMPMLEAAVRRRCPGAAVRAPATSPEVGAAVMAAWQAGLDPASFYPKILAQS